MSSSSSEEAFRESPRKRLRRVRRLYRRAGDIVLSESSAHSTPSSRQSSESGGDRDLFQVVTDEERVSSDDYHSQSSEENGAAGVAGARNMHIAADAAEGNNGEADVISGNEDGNPDQDNGNNPLNAPDQLPPPQDVPHGAVGHPLPQQEDLQPALNQQDAAVQEALHEVASSEASDATQSDPSSEDESVPSSFDSSDGEGENMENNGNQPLYNGATLTLAESIIAILTFSMSNNLTGVALQGLLELISLHCPQPNACLTTLFTFKKYFANIGRQTLKLHYFCTVCFSNLEEKDGICDECEEQTEVSFFIEIPLLAQLQRLFKRPGFYNKLQYRFNRQKHMTENIEDIYDGELYCEETAGNGFLNSRNNISFMMYFDGISIFKSSKLSVWPLYLVINELSYSERTLKENIVLAGLWFGKMKPKVNLFLEPFHRSLTILRDEGFDLMIPGAREPIRVRGKVLCATCDLQARALFMQMNLFNGYYGCSFCKSRGERYPVGQSSVHVHPYHPPGNIAPARTNEEMPRLANIAIENNGSYFGVKGLSLLFFIMVNMILGMAIDIMHCIFIGVIKQVMKFWFDKSFANEPHSCYGIIDVIDERLRNIRPPGSVSRAPRSIKNEIKLWKASEFKNFFFYYSIPILEGLLDAEYLNHHVKLVSAVYLLSQNSISLQQIEAASILLHDYVCGFQQLYGLRYMSMNVHMLVHLPAVVRLLGPLWVYSCFFLEDLNGGLSRLVHGNQHAAVQICSSATLYMSLSTMVQDLPQLSVVKRFCERQSALRTTPLKIAEIINQYCSALGTYECISMQALQEVDIRDKLRAKILAINNNQVDNDVPVPEGHFQAFFRYKYKACVVFSEEYPRASKKMSTFISFRNGAALCLGSIIKYFRWSPCECNNICFCMPATYFAVCKLYDRVPYFVHNIPNARMGYLSSVVETNEIVIVDVLREVVNYLYFFINVESDDGNKRFIALPVNTLEKE